MKNSFRRDKTAIDMNMETNLPYKDREYLYELTIKEVKEWFVKKIKDERYKITDILFNVNGSNGVLIELTEIKLNIKLGFMLANQKELLELKDVLGKELVMAKILGGNDE